MTPEAERPSVGTPRVPDDVRAARGYLEVARADRDKGFDLSACLTAQKAAEVALQSWLGGRGMDAAADDLPSLLAGVPGRTPELERAAAALERFRVDMVSPYRSAAGPQPEPTPEAAASCCEAAAAVVAHVEGLFARLEPGEA
ncbi:MAG: HEPN domain-containing protein [Gemmatimonadota bacterium]